MPIEEVIEVAIEMPTASDVLNGDARWSCEATDAVAFLDSLPDDSVDLLFTSPPYELARTYGIGEKMVGGQQWVDWMVRVVSAAAPKVRGLIAVNCEGQTRGYRYSGAPFLLFADLHRAGFNLRKPPIFHRVGIPGSGGPDWLRNDYEPILCVTREGRLPWSDNTACGHTPKWAPGGEMSHMLSDGTRVNQWGKIGSDTGAGNKDADGNIKSNGKARPSHKMTSKGEAKEVPAWLREGMHTGVQNKIKQPKPKNVRETSGIRQRGVANRQVLREGGKLMTAPLPDGTTEVQSYLPPAMANPGNVYEPQYSLSEVYELLKLLEVADESMPEILRLTVGGGQMGHAISHSNEAPFPLDLPTFFVKSFAPPNGVVCDPFSGSGTVCHAAFEHGRRFIGCDLRESQVALCSRRLATVTPSMFSGVAPS
jgi:site-specific DNA-methyltransferase (adenine-specific)